MPRESRSAKAERLLVGFRVSIVRADRGEVLATVRGDHGLYVVRHAGGRWACNCEAFTADCAHALAVRRVTLPLPLPAVLAHDLMVGAST